MRSGETLYYLEMVDPDEMVPSPRAEDLLRLVEIRNIDQVRALTLGIGLPYDWPSTHWDDQRWREYGQRGDIRHWAAVVADEQAGLLSLVLRDGEVEVDTFGLLPAATGRGLGSAFLTLALRLAWSLNSGVRRVILHTSSEDHPYALQNYLRRGFRLYDTRPPGSSSCRLPQSGRIGHGAWPLRREGLPGRRQRSYGQRAGVSSVPVGGCSAPWISRRRSAAMHVVRPRLARIRRLMASRSTRVGRSCTAAGGTRPGRSPRSTSGRRARRSSTTSRQRFERSAWRLPHSRRLPCTRSSALRLLDLRTMAARRAVGLREEDLIAEDRAACQRVGGAAWKDELQGVLAPAATGSGLVLAAFLDQTTAGAIAVERTEVFELDR